MPTAAEADGQTCVECNAVFSSLELDRCPECKSEFLLPVEMIPCQVDDPMDCYDGDHDYRTNEHIKVMV